MIQAIYTRAITYYREYGLIPLVIKGLRTAFARFVASKRLGELVTRSKLLTTIYFYIQGNFHHEQKNIIHGKFINDDIGTEGQRLEHRRVQLTHFAEKGLSVPESDRRDTFGEGYIEELVCRTEAAWNSRIDPTTDEQLLWSVDVLDAYFQATENSPSTTIAKAKNSFAEFVQSIDYMPTYRKPRSRQDVIGSGVTFEQLQSLADQRSSTRWFLDKEVPHELLDKAVRIAGKSPSACNRQSFEFRIYDKQEILDDLLELRIGTDAFKEGIPTLVVLTGKQRAYSESERNTIFIDASLAAMSFQFALEALGLASCSINWHMYPEQQNKISEIIGLDSDEQVIFLMAVGYPDPEGKVPYSSKKHINHIRSYNRTD